MRLAHLAQAQRGAFSSNVSIQQHKLRRCPAHTALRQHPKTPVFQKLQAFSVVTTTVHGWVAPQRLSFPTWQEDLRPFTEPATVTPAPTDPAKWGFVVSFCPLLLHLPIFPFPKLHPNTKPPKQNRTRDTKHTVAHGKFATTPSLPIIATALAIQPQFGHFLPGLMNYFLLYTYHSTVASPLTASCSFLTTLF